MVQISIDYTPVRFVPRYDRFAHTLEGLKVGSGYCQEFSFGGKDGGERGGGGNEVGGVTKFEKEISF